MAKYESDIVQYVFDQYQKGFDQIDTTALDVLIEEFLETPSNGYMSETVQEWDADSTSYINIVTDSTSPSLTVDEWKEENLEKVFNQAMLQNNQISIRDHNSPNYPLIDFRDKLFDFDTSTSIDYEVTPDTTGDIYIEYEYPISKIDGMYIQGGLNGVSDYGSLDDHNIIAFYLAFSNDGENWSYVHQEDISFYLNNTYYDTTALNVIQTMTISTDQETAKSNPYWYDQEFPIEDETVLPIKFTTSIEARYWRIYFVDLEEFLKIIGEDSGYTGYTASVSHLRYEQYKQHAEELVRESVNVTTVDPLLFTGGVIYETKTFSSSPYPTPVSIGEFHFANDDQYSGIVSMLTMKCSNSSGTYSAKFTLQVRDPTSTGVFSWVSLKSIDCPAGEDVILTSSWYEVPRKEGQYKREFRVTVQSQASSFTAKIEGDAIVIYKSGANMISNWPNKP